MGASLGGFFFGGGGLALATIAYNRDAYANNVSMNQDQMYQEKNYFITFITAVREELRDVMSIFVGRMANYILVSTLLFGFAATLLAEGPNLMGMGDSPKVVVQLFSVSICLTLVSHVLCILIALQGLAAAYQQAVTCLCEIVPEQPDDYTFNYLEQCTLGFEQSGEVWRMPLTDYPWWCLPKPLRSRWPRRSAVKEWKERKDYRVQCPKIAERLDIREELPRNRWKREADSEKAGISPKEGASSDYQRTSYFEQIQTLTSNWEPFKELTRVLLAHSVMENIQALAFFGLGRYHNAGLHLDVVLCLMLTCLGLFVMWQLRGWLRAFQDDTHFGFRVFMAILLLGALGPALCAVMLPLIHPNLHTILGMLCSLLAVLCEVCLICLVSEKCYERQCEPQQRQDCRTLSRTGSTSISAEACNGMQQQDAADGKGDPFDQMQAGSVQPQASARPPWTKPQGRGSFEVHLKSIVEDCKIQGDELRSRHLGPYERKAIRALNAFSCVCWGVSFALFALGLYGALQGSQRGHAGVAVATGQLDMSWPNKNCLPRALGCDGGHIFIADEFNIYELVVSPGLQTQSFHLQPWSCYLTQKVADIAVTCDDKGACHPFALLQGQPSGMVDCATNNEAPLALLQASTHVERMTALNSTRILTVEGKDVVLRKRSRMIDQNLFQALWPIAEVPQPQSGMLRAVDTTNGRMLLFFYDGGTESRPVVVRHDVASDVSFTWELPSDLSVLLTACTETQDSILVVASSDQQVKIVRLKLEPHRF